MRKNTQNIHKSTREHIMMTRPGFLALAVMLVLTVALALAGPNTRDMSSCCVGATLPYLSRLRGGISKADAQEVPKRGQKPPKSEQKPVK